jgi:hypothetical protein
MRIDRKAKRLKEKSIFWLKNLGLLFKFCPLYKINPSLIGTLQPSTKTD